MKKIVMGMALCPLMCCAMQHNKDLKRKAVAYVNESKKKKQDQKTEAIAQFYHEQDVMALCDDMKNKMKLDLDKKLMQENKVALQSHDEKIFEVFDLDIISPLATYYALIKKFKSNSILPSWDVEHNKTTTLAVSFVGGIYKFDEGTSPLVIQLCVAYFKDPTKLPEIQQEILKHPQQVLEIWYNVSRLGIAPLTTFVGDHMFELLLRDQDVQKKLLQCVDMEGIVSSQQIKDVFVGCFGGDEPLFDTIFEKYYHNNPRFWNMQHPVQEINIESGKPVHKVTVSNTGTYVTAEIKHDCLLIYKKNKDKFELDQTIQLRHLDKGASVTQVVFSPDDSLCMVYQKRGLWVTWHVYDCTTWRILEDFGRPDDCHIKKFLGFTQDNLLILDVYLNDLGDDLESEALLYDVYKKCICSRDVNVNDVKYVQKTLDPNVEKELLAQVQKAVKALGTYEQPYNFELENLLPNGRAASISFYSTFSRGSGMMITRIIFDCHAQEIVWECSDFDLEVFSNGSGCVEAHYQSASVIPWRDKESKICFYATTLQGIVEKYLGDDFFKQLQSTSWFSSMSSISKK